MGFWLFSGHYLTLVGIGLLVLEIDICTEATANKATRIQYTLLHI